MIGSLSGLLVEKAPPRILLEVAGVGYDVEVPMSTLYALPATGGPLRLLIHQGGREDALLLYGFATEPERVLFRHLLKVSGVGPRIALAILSGISLDAFAQLLQAEDVAALTRIPGVGRKTAERVLVEQGVVQDGDLIVLPIGEPIGKAGGTNTMKIVKVGEHRR